MDTDLAQQPELRRLVFPVFVHFYLNMISTGNLTPGKNFWNNHKQEHEATYGHDLQELSTLSLPAHVEDNALSKLYRENRYKVTLTQTTRGLLLHFLDDTVDQGGRIILDVINRYIELNTRPGRAAIFGGDDEGTDNVGIHGHTSEKTNDTGVLVTVKLGALPMDKELSKDVEDELRDEDLRMKDVTRHDELGIAAGGTLLDEFQKIKREESEDSPMRELVPLPPYTVADVEREVKLVKETREKMQVRGGPSPALPSVCMYTFHNTHDGYVMHSLVLLFCLPMKSPLP